MSREDWEAYQVHEGERVPINVTRTPMAAVASDASVVAGIAQRFSDATAEITIYRWDEKDQPTPLDLDRYLVWEKLPSHHRYEAMVVSSSTEDNESLRSYLNENVFIVKAAPGDDHRLSELPASVVSVMRRRKYGP